MVIFIREALKFCICAYLKEDNALSLYHDATRESVARGVVMAPPSTADNEALREAVVSILADEKAEDIVTIDLNGKSEIADYMIVCSGRSSRQVTAIAEKLVQELKKQFERASKIEGKETGDWVLIDTGDIVVHVFRPEVREFYQLEKMWQTPATLER